MVKAKASATESACKAHNTVASQTQKKSRIPTSFETRLYEVSQGRQAMGWWLPHIDQSSLPVALRHRLLLRFPVCWQVAMNRS
jgi:hypothetical protein